MIALQGEVTKIATNRLEYSEINWSRPVNM